MSFFLQKFTLKLQHDGPRRKRKLQQLPKCSHQHLKVVEFIGFVGRSIDLELAFYLLENATILEKMIVEPSFKDAYGQCAAMERAMQLVEKLPQEAQLVIR